MRLSARVAYKGMFMARLAGVLFLLLICPVVSVHAQVTPLEVVKLRPNLFLVTGGSPNVGGSANTVVFVRSTDVVVIDTKGPRPWWGDAIADEVKRLTKLPITTGDHKTEFGLSADAIRAGRGPNGYVSFHGRRYSRRRNSFGSVTSPPDPLIVLVTRILAPS